MTAIAQAVETFDLPESTSLSSSYRKDASNDSTGSFSVFKAPSISSLNTNFTNMSSGSLGSRNSAYSHGSRHSLGSMNSLKSKERRRRRRFPTRAPKADSDDGPRLFQCTFCTDRFKNKYDWYVTMLISYTLEQLCPFLLPNNIGELYQEREHPCSTSLTDYSVQVSARKKPSFILREVALCTSR